uniref:Uncharacterized protein n=1 Tax=Acrobeloides nanus TaxID=290746 RepID=A0A914DE37_9BILA
MQIIEALKNCNLHGRTYANYAVGGAFVGTGLGITAREIVDAL